MIPALNGRFWSDERGVPFLDKGDVKRVTFKYE
jgi:hypothetical protein